MVSRDDGNHRHNARGFGYQRGADDFAAFPHRHIRTQPATGPDRWQSISATCRLTLPSCNFASLNAGLPENAGGLASRLGRRWKTADGVGCILWKIWCVGDWRLLRRPRPGLFNNCRNAQTLKPKERQPSYDSCRVNLQRLLTIKIIHLDCGVDQWFQKKVPRIAQCLGWTGVDGEGTGTGRRTH